MILSRKKYSKPKMLQERRERGHQALPVELKLPGAQIQLGHCERRGPGPGLGHLLPDLTRRPRLQPRHPASGGDSQNFLAKCPGEYNFSVANILYLMCLKSSRFFEVQNQYLIKM